MAERAAFDYIADHEEWMKSGFFPEEVQARLKGEYRGDHHQARPLPLSPDSLQPQACKDTGENHLTESKRQSSVNAVTAHHKLYKIHVQ